MNKIISSIAVASLMGLTALASATPASAASFSIGFGNGGNNSGHYNQRDRYVSQYCDTHSRDRDCNDWRSNRSHWSNARYQSWYRSHHFSGNSVAAGIFGFALGAAINSSVNAQHTYMSDSARCGLRGPLPFLRFGHRYLSRL